EKAGAFKAGALEAGTEKAGDPGEAAEEGEVRAYIEARACEGDSCFLADAAPERVHNEFRDHVLRALYTVLSRHTGRELPWGILTGVRPTKLFMEQMDEGNEDLQGYIKRRYLCSDGKIELATAVAGKERELLRRAASGGAGSVRPEETGSRAGDGRPAEGFEDTLSLYVGIPFCPSICNYCTFGSTPIGPNRALVGPYLEALKKEIAAAAELFAGKKVTTVYFGGGTPTSIAPGELGDLIERVCREFAIDPKVTEFSVEAGRPDTITREHLSMLKEMGVNRISINPQTMSDKTLRLIGREHTADMVVDAFRLARECGHENINMDLIMGLTGETPDDFEHTLSEIEKLDPEGLTVHTLARKRAARLVTGKEQYEGMEATGVQEMQRMADAFAKRRGYEPYYLYRQKNMTDNLENVGYSKPGFECLYNILSMEAKQTLLGLGAGASSKVIVGTEKFRRVENVKSVRDYVSRIDEMIGRKVEYVRERGMAQG
ncbi:MAG: coproporphyrinogen dehydrogenase HemZ, partial [Lachnospiraceae bacterium]|nr:coproporphyrinogen dehydrogenase HemZ [Lachnospiraceae bacterium]